MPGVRARLMDCLRAIQAEGVRSLPIDEGARSVLRSWMLAAREGRRAPMRAAVSGRLPVSGSSSELETPPPPEKDMARVSAEAGLPPVSITAALEEAARESAAGVVEEGEEELAPFFRPGGDTPEEVWSNFARMLPLWEPLRSLGTLRETAVMGEGDRRAAVMLVGDAPNYYDERSGKPFAGASGEKLDGMLSAMGLDRSSVYLTYAVPFRPALPRQTTNNRPPSAEEMRLGRPVLEAQAALVRPRVIVALGVIAARSLLQNDDWPLDAFRRKEGRFSGIPVVVTHHPSYLLRTSDLAERRLVWEDMLHAMELGGLPISEKQRRYFLPKPTSGGAS